MRRNEFFFFQTTEKSEPFGALNEVFQTRPTEWSRATDGTEEVGSGRGYSRTEDRIPARLEPAALDSGDTAG